MAEPINVALRKTLCISIQLKIIKLLSQYQHYDLAEEILYSPNLKPCHLLRLYGVLVRMKASLYTVDHERVQNSVKAILDLYKPKTLKTEPSTPQSAQLAEPIVVHSASTTVSEMLVEEPHSP